MALTDKLGMVVNHDINPNTYAYYDLIESVVRLKPFQIHQSQTQIQLLDVGCGHAGSYVVSRYVEAFPTAKVFNLDIEPLVVHWLNASRKLVADAHRMPFAKNSFDVVHDGYHILDHDLKYTIASEVRRVLKPTGLFIFYSFERNWCDEKPREREIQDRLLQRGFNQIEHLLRIPHPSAFWDIYAARS